MKVVAFDFYDKERSRPAEIEVKKVAKGATFTLDDVSYVITKLFHKKGIKLQCIEIQMVAYKIGNTVTTFSHKCPVKKGQMQKMKGDTREALVGKYGKKTVEAWEAGKQKMKIGSLTAVCPDCKCVFWKDKHELPPTVDIISVRGKKRLIKRT